jgi:hypothetical protein
LGKAVKINAGVGNNPKSALFKIEILHDPKEPTYTIEYFCEPDMAMALLRLLEEIQKRENFQLPGGDIDTRTIQ